MPGFSVIDRQATWDESGSFRDGLPLLSVVVPVRAINVIAARRRAAG
jgi:hypothetical protein